MNIQLKGDLGFDCSLEQMSGETLPNDWDIQKGCYSKSIQTKASLAHEQFI